MFDFDKYHIRIIQEDDLENYYQLIEDNRSRLEDFFTGTVANTSTLKETELFLKKIIAQHNAKTYYPYLILNTSNDTIVGFIDVKGINWNIPKAEIGCYIDKNNTGLGLASKALSILADFYLNDLKFNKLLIRIHKTNVASIKSAVKCGFKLEGEITNDYVTTKGELVDLLYYGKTK